MGMYLTQALHRTIRSRPQGLATVYEERRQTYEQLSQRVAQLGGLLQSLGVAPQNRVAWLAFNSDRVIEMILGSFWAGAIGCPINTRWSTAEIIDSIHDCAPKIFIIEDKFLGMLEDLQKACPEVDTWLVLGDGPSPTGLLHYETCLANALPVEDYVASGDTPALILYTGGTTSKPKGVIQTHACMMSASLGLAATVGPPGKACLMAPPLFHMGGILLAFYHILGGGTFVFTPSFNPAQALELIRKENITDTLLVPTMIQSLLNEIEKSPEEPVPLRRLLYGAAPSSVTLLEHAQRLLPRTELFQGLGMSETAVTCMLTDADHKAGKAQLPGIVGRPCPHAEIRVIDAGGHECDRNVVGEITVRGPSVSPGYWNNAAETAKAFRNGWIHTGDAGFIDSEGYLRLVDRIKDMIISGGENIYSAEVENAVALHGAVEQCSAVGRPDAFWGETVHVAVVLRPNKSLTLEELQQHCRATLAGYKCPRSMSIMAALPLTPAGKVAKNQLREMLVEN